MEQLALGRIRSKRYTKRNAAGLKYFLISIPFFVFIFAFSYVGLA